MRVVLASFAVLAGAGFMFAAALGVARLPDLFTRMQAATKAATVGVVGVMCAIAVGFWDGPATILALLVSVFFLLTAPVGAHAIARSAHARGVPLAPGTRVEIREQVREGDRGRMRERGGALERRAGRVAQDHEARTDGGG